MVFSTYFYTNGITIIGFSNFANRACAPWDIRIWMKWKFETPIRRSWKKDGKTNHNFCLIDRRMNDTREYIIPYNSKNFAQAKTCKRQKKISEWSVAAAARQNWCVFKNKNQPDPFNTPKHINEKLLPSRQQCCTATFQPIEHAITGEAHP